MSDAKLKTAQKAALAKNTISFDEGQIVFKEGDTSTELYLLLSGKVAVVKGESVIAELDEPMTYFGEMGAILNEPRTATIRTIDKSEFMIVPGDKLETLIDVSPAVGKKLIGMFAKRLSKMNDERIKLNGDVAAAKARAQKQIAQAAQDYKRLLFTIAMVFDQSKLPQVAELLKFGKGNSVLASYAGRLEVDERNFQSSQLLTKMFRLSQTQPR